MYEWSIVAKLLFKLIILFIGVILLKSVLRFVVWLIEDVLKFAGVIIGEMAIGFGTYGSKISWELISEVLEIPEEIP
jgi:hypothetical protein